MCFLMVLVNPSKRASQSLNPRGVKIHRLHSIFKDCQRWCVCVENNIQHGVWTTENKNKCVIKLYSHNWCYYAPSSIFMENGQMNITILNHTDIRCLLWVSDIHFWPWVIILWDACNWRLSMRVWALSLPHLPSGFKLFSFFLHFVVILCFKNT